MKCLRCGKDFEPAPKVARRQKYCSRKCSVAAWNDRQRLQRTLAKSVKLLKAGICHECGKSFTPSYVGEKFCSDECRFAFFHPNLQIALAKLCGWLVL